MFHDGKFIKGVTEEVVVATRNSSIRAALRKGWDVISDDTNLKSSVVRDLIEIAVSEGAEYEFQDFFDVSVDECITRDRCRVAEGGRYVGEEVIRDMHNRYLRGKKLPLPAPSPRPKVTEGVFEPLPHGDKPAIIVDIDGTTAHNNGHRGFYDYDRVGFDEPKEDVILMVKAAIQLGCSALFVSGRNDVCREYTAEWIWEHILKSVAGCWGIYPKLLESPNNEQEARHKLFMRKDGDMRRDDVVKYEIYRDYIAPEYDVTMAFDDRDQVVAMWRQIGITCAQVDFGDF
jgi:hypothetical protein